MLHPGGTEISVTRSLWASGLKGQQPRDRKQLTRASLSVAGWAVLGASVSRGPHALACQTQEGHQIQEVFSLCPQRCTGLSRQGVRPQGQPQQPKKPVGKAGAVVRPTGSGSPGCREGTAPSTPPGHRSRQGKGGIRTVSEGAEGVLQGKGQGPEADKSQAGVVHGRD